MTDWMTIRVVLTGQPHARMPRPPGRVLLVHADHAFSDLADAIDTGFGRWDLTPSHQFDVEGRMLLSSDAVDEGPEDADDSDEVTVGEVGLRAAARFGYTFDLSEQWTHECTVEEVGVDPFEAAGEEPEVPVPVFGWGQVPDQYGRMTEDDDTDEDGVQERIVPADFDVDEESDLAAWDAAEAASWKVVARALGRLERPRDDDELAAAVAEVRSHRDDDNFPYDVLWAAVDAEGAALPDEDAACWLELAAAVVAPRDDVPLDADAVAAWAALEPADWAGAVIELVRGGVGTRATPEDLVALIERCPEVEGEDLTTEDETVLIEGLGVIVALWAALGAVDAEHRLTALGAWGLPEALRLAWDA
ncbi:hypothetical protein BH20ACT8_BH20ACT8_06480 [soil metagenome]